MQTPKKRFWSTSEIRPEYGGVQLNSSGVGWSTHTSSVAFSSLHRPLLLISSFNKLVLGANFRGRSKPTDRFRRIPTLGSYRIPKLGVRMSVHSPESDRILWYGIDSSCFYYFYIHFSHENSLAIKNWVVFHLWLLHFYFSLQYRTNKKKE